MYLGGWSAARQTPGVATFAKGSVSQLPVRHVAFVEKLEHAKILAQLVEETGGNVQEERRRRHYAPSAVDGVALRGIPAVGRHGIGGAIGGTKPGANLFR
jgi:hypothetical protein